MGRNNHHAGLHMIRFSKYGQYDDLDFYDRLVQQRRVLLEAEMDEQNPNAIEDITQIESKDTKPKKKHKKKENKNTYDPWNIQIQYGTEEVLDIQRIIGPYQDMMANIMVLALKHKKDIYSILSECEDVFSKDSRINPPPKTDWCLCPKLDHSIAFLSLVAEKLDCNLYDFFIDNKLERQKIVYRVIDFLRRQSSIDTVFFDYGTINEDGEAEFSIRNFDFEYGMSDRFARSLIDNMALTFYKEQFAAGTEYAISFGDLTVRFSTSRTYSLKGAYLYDEEEGQLKDYIEETIAKNPQWLEE